MQKNDYLWKGILEDIFDDFLRFFYPDADDLFDFSKGFEYLDKELEQLFPPEDDQFETRFVDKLVKVYRKNGREEWILVHIEIQGYADKNFPERIYQYYSRIYDKYGKDITAIAIFTDDQASFHPDTFEQECLGTKLTFVFNTYKILNQSETELQASDSPFAFVALTVKNSLKSKKIDEQQLYDLKYDLLKHLLSKKIDKGKIHALMNFLKFYIRFENRELDRNFEKVTEALTQNKKTMGIEELIYERAKQEGMLEERKRKDIELAEKNREIARYLKKSGVDIKIISESTGLSNSEIEKL